MLPTINPKFLFTYFFLIFLICLSLTACRQTLPENVVENTLILTDEGLITKQPTPLMPVTNTPSPIPLTPTPILTNTITPFLSDIQPFYTYEIVNVFPHDPSAFTQGLIIFEGFLYESTGRHGHSSLRKVELETGKVLNSFELSEEYFAEGLSIYQNRLYQLTWQENTGFIYDKDSFSLINSFSYPSDGWGLSIYNESLLMSDGSNTLHVLDPETLQETFTLNILDKNDQPLEKINELEVISDFIFANIWQTDRIVIIDPRKSRVISEIDLSNLADYCPQNSPEMDVLNGIAYDPDNKRLFVTGKLWPCLFEIKLISQ